MFGVLFLVGGWLVGPALPGRALIFVPRTNPSPSREARAFCLGCFVSGVLFRVFCFRPFVFGVFGRWLVVGPGPSGPGFDFCAPDQSKPEPGGSGVLFLAFCGRALVFWAWVF